MKAWKNVMLVAVAVVTVALAVCGMFAIKRIMNEKEQVIPTPEPVAVETKTESPEEGPQETPEPVQKPEETPSPEGLALQKKVERVLASMTLRQKIGQMFVVDMSQLGGSSNTSINQRTRSRLNTYPVGGVLLTGVNMSSAPQTTAFIQELQRNADTPMFIAVEEEGGDASLLASNPNLNIPKVKDARQYGDDRDAEGATNAARQIAEALGSLGFNLNLAPVADVALDGEASVLGRRCFGTDAKLTAQLAEAQVKGYQEVNISAVMKYFPGCGGVSESTKDGYVETTRTKEEMRAVEWIPYMTGITAGVDAIMMSNIAAPQLTGDRTPCSLSQKVVGILRSELGYNGMIISGALNEQAITKYYSSSEAVLKAIDAGADIMYLPASLEGTYSAVESAVRNGRLSEERIDQSVSRILAVKIVRKLIDPEDYPEPSPTPDPDEQNWEEDDWSDEDDGDDWSDEDDGEDNGWANEEEQSEEDGEESGSQSEEEPEGGQ